MHSQAAQIRPAARADAHALADLLGRVFAETYGHVIPPRVLARHLGEAYAAAQVTRELRRRHTRFIVAEHDGRLVGCAKIERTPIPPGVPVGAIELAKLYLDRTFHGRGLAAGLLDRALDAAAGEGYSDVWLCVWEHNPRAIAFYRKHGFHTIGAMPVMVGPVHFRDLVMLRRSNLAHTSPTMHGHDQ